MTTQLSQRALDIPPSPIRKLLPFELEARARGIQVFKLNIGQPDVQTPRRFFEALNTDLPPVLGYGPSQGLPEFQQAVAQYYQRIGIPFETGEIMATVGGSEALFFAFLAVANPGDEIIVFEPFYTNYIGFAIYAGVKLVPFTTRAENGFHLPERAELEKLITPRTRAILVCSPNNPTGTVLTRDELEMIGQLAVDRDLFVISDEVYREFAYDGQLPTSMMAIEKAWDRIILCDSISKRFSACGARIGNLATKNAQVYLSVLRFGQARLCPATAEQMGAITLYTLGPDYYEQVRREYMARRDAIFEGLMAIPQVVCQKPAGAFYIMAQLPIDDGDRFAQWLLTDFESGGQTVMVAPGAGFYATPGAGKQEIRLAYVLESAHCRRAMELLREAVQVYPGSLLK
ncbi:MAG: aspartate aminotransferase [Deltaproteobacteria bacterium HGW-Deltaproteobacteria-22]|jgi:aspartate aminotransferase|nr:MAG: aspartate aminotransferase [Deltaproteobacteria bacterium HGW-Deltaproteobacteria-22]